VIPGTRFLALWHGASDRPHDDHRSSDRRRVPRDGGKLVAEPEPQYRTIGAFDTMGRLPSLADERRALRRGGVLVQPLTLSDDQPSFPMLPCT
jgi:hypothetical protein